VLSFTGTKTVSTLPVATATPTPVTAPSNAVVTGLASTSRCSWSPGFASVSVPSTTTDRPAAVPPTGMAVLRSLWNWARPVGESGGTGTDVLKSTPFAVLPPNGVQSLARPVWSRVRARQR